MPGKIRLLQTKCTIHQGKTICNDKQITPVASIIGREGKVDGKSGRLSLFPPIQYVLLPQEESENAFRWRGRQHSLKNIAEILIADIPQPDSNGITMCEEVTYSRNRAMMTFSVKTHFLCTLAVIFEWEAGWQDGTFPHMEIKTITSQRL